MRNSVFGELQTIIAEIGNSPDPEQIEALKYHLLLTLHRANKLQQRVAGLEQNERRAPDYGAVWWEHKKRIHYLQREVEEAKSELAKKDENCRRLEEICKSLLVTIESATHPEHGPETRRSAGIAGEET